MTLKPNMLKWIREGERGISSETIFEVLADHPLLDKTHMDRNVPHDPSDFYRCHKLLQAVPEWNGKLNRVAKVFPHWQVFVDNWDLLESLLEQESMSPKLYAALDELERVMYAYPHEQPNLKKFGMIRR
ncbi:MAG: hypothetical protein PHC39_04890 [Proteiniphilum sp.]|nr:hypothetical protein [Proteiniphilum sp.]